MGTIKIGHTELMLHCDGKRKTYKELNKRQKTWGNHVVKTYQADATAHNFHYANDLAGRASNEVGKYEDDRK